MSATTSIPGYTYGTGAVARSPVSPADFELMKKSVLFGDEDVAALRRSHGLLEDQVEAILDVWYGFVGRAAQQRELRATAMEWNDDPRCTTLSAANSGKAAARFASGPPRTKTSRRRSGMGGRVRDLAGGDLSKRTTGRAPAA